MLSWARKRQIAYLSAILGLFIVAGLSFYVFYRPKPTCSDGKKNQDEVGIDCGGSCQLACRSQLEAVTTWWTRIFPTTKGKYDVVSLVENPNTSFGAEKVKYLFRVYDKYNVRIAERAGETFFLPQEKFAIFEPNIDVGQKEAARAFLYLDDTSPWIRVKSSRPELSIAEKIFENDGQPRLQAKVRNNTLKTLRDIQFVAVLLDGEGNAIASSATVVNSLEGNQTKDIYFSWPPSLGEPPAIIDIYPKLNIFDINNGQ